MSSDQSSSSGKMSSITRRLSASFLRGRLGRVIISSLLLFVILCVFYLASEEYRAVGYLTGGTGREIFTQNALIGNQAELIYRLTPVGKDPVEVGIKSGLITIAIVCGALLLLRLLWLFAVSLPRKNRKIREILVPISELALKADELSRMEFGEDKYHLLEDAISNLDADESSRLSLGDSDLLGIEAAVNNLLTRIREANRQQARFVNDASHELRTPIAVIGGYADMLARWGKDDEKVLSESISAIQTETERMKHLVEQLLFLARGDAGRTQLQLESVTLSSLMKEAYEESLMIDEKHVYRLKEGEDMSVSADPGLLKQAVRILLDNAAKYTKEGDEIVLSYGQEGGRPFLQVQDSGIGMAEADAQHMFERFFRADKARSFEGTGLGLSIAKWIVDKHRGHFEVLSRTDIGTRIRIVL